MCLSGFAGLSATHREVDVFLVKSEVETTRELLRSAVVESIKKIVLFGCNLKMKQYPRVETISAEVTPCLGDGSFALQSFLPTIL